MKLCGTKHAADAGRLGGSGSGAAVVLVRRPRMLLGWITPETGGVTKLSPSVNATGIGMAANAPNDGNPLSTTASNIILIGACPANHCSSAHSQNGMRSCHQCVGAMSQSIMLNRSTSGNLSSDLDNDGISAVVETTQGPSAQLPGCTCWP